MNDNEREIQKLIGYRRNVKLLLAELESISDVYHSAANTDGNKTGTKIGIVINGKVYDLQCNANFIDTLVALVRGHLGHR